MTGGALDGYAPRRGVAFRRTTGGIRIGEVMRCRRPTSRPENRPRISLLGPVELRGTAGTRPVTAALERAVLASLALQLGHAVPLDALIDGLWEEADQPASAEKTVQVLISRLRGAFGGGLRDSPIRTVAGGYRLDSGSVDIDAVAFEAGVAAARRMIAENRLEDGSAALIEALAWWRGPALMDVRDRPFAVGEAVRLDELRVSVSEDLAAARVRLGHIDEALPDLERLVRDRPLDERAAELLVRTLFAAGRQAAAVAAYHRVREALRDDLGVDPGEALETTYRLVLNQDPSLRAIRDQPAAPGHDAIAPTLKPWGSPVPAPIGRFVGRTGEVADLVSAIAADRLVTVVGPGGVGKTRLAIEAARTASATFQGRVAFIDLSAVRDASLVPRRSSKGLQSSDELDGPQDERRGHHDERLLGALQGAPALLVLDNFEQVQAASSFLAGLLTKSPQLRVLVTSRMPLGIRGEREVSVMPLALPAEGERSLSQIEGNEAVAFFLDELRRHTSVTLSPDNAGVIAEICRRLDGLPLALELVAAGARATPLPDLVRRLERRLDIEARFADVPARQATLRATVTWTTEMMSPGARDLFARLSVFVGGFGLEAARAVAAQEEDLLERLDELLRHSLVLRRIGGLPGEPAANDPDGRFGMLETIREIGLDELDGAGSRADGPGTRARVARRAAARGR